MMRRNFNLGVVNFFLNLYGRKPTNLMELHTSSFPNHDQSDILFLNREVSKD